MDLNEMREKKDNLKKHLREIADMGGSLAIAFSGGVDSTFLLATAYEELGDGVFAITVKSDFVPGREILEAEGFCRERGIAQYVVEVSSKDIKGFCENPVNRCYLCKKELFSRIKNISQGYGGVAVAEGSNMDDHNDYRPGMTAIRELGILSPLQAANLYKDEIRTLSYEMGLPTADKPSYACLASRFVYGERITEEKLRMVEKAEYYLYSLGFRQVRVRIHGRLARIEVPPQDSRSFYEEVSKQPLVEELKKLGFIYVTLDLQGYRTGSMNEALNSQG